MKVRRLEIAGFKSFADKGTLDFSQGLCAVVGPNGCGKSNVVDAVRWVLGEQSARLLRGQAMEDVIFNGSTGRKPLGMAEVSLVFENDGSLTLPQYADLAEIMVTRRLFRNGDSEYCLNKVPCRLKDIQQLLMDTGLGNRAYAIIEQGRVAAFIEARPEDRRLWLEEAAGITRFKNQKKTALKKMEAAEENLNRLQDILLEVEAQIAKLERQAQKAQRFRELKERIRELDLNIASHEYVRLARELKETRAEAEAVGAQLLLANQRQTGLDTDLETLKVQMVAAEADIGQAGERRLATQGEIQKAENELSLLGREAENQKRLKERYEKERDSLAAGLKERQQDLTRARRLLETAEARLGELEGKARQAQARTAELAQMQRAQEARLDADKGALVDLLARTSRARNRLADLDRYQAELNRRQESLAGREKSLGEELAALGEQRDQARTQISAARDELAGLEERRQVLEEEKAQAQARRRESGGREQSLTRACHDLAAAVQAREASLGSHEWAGGEVQKVLKAARAGQPAGELPGLVAEHLAVAPGREEAVAAGLGPLLQALVVKDAAQAERVLALVAERRLGRVTVVDLAELAAAPRPTPPEGSQPLAEFATPRPGFAPLAALLAGIGFLADPAEARRLAGGLAPGQAVVDGQGVRHLRPGVCQAGRGGGASVLVSRNELDQQRRELAGQQEALVRAGRERQEAETALAACEEELTVLLAQARQREREHNQAEQAEHRLADTLALKERELEALSFDAGELDQQRDRLMAEREELDGQLDQAEAGRREREAELTAAQAGLEEGRQRLEEARQDEAEARLELANLQSQADHARGESRRLDQETKDLAGRLEELSREARAADGKVAELARRKGDEQARLGGLYRQMEEREEALKVARSLHAQAQMQQSDLEASLKEARAEQRAVEGQRQELALRESQLRMSQENLCDQIMERCRVDLTLDHAGHLPAGAFDPEASRERLNTLRQRLLKLGPVNLEAISEHQALRERHDFLSGQKADLEASLADLKQAIRKINQTSRTRFLETLDEVNARLTEVFPILFPEGRAQLALEEDVDPLEAGLHLMVELPGKKVKHLEAMSGGEKALSAVAVLFALFLIRPAPFCILDEVDAPLDEANIGRFHELLARLSRHCQIIMITHSRRTMEIMDLLYGVTMEEKGVSKLLSVNLKRGQALAA